MNSTTKTVTAVLLTGKSVPVVGVLCVIGVLTITAATAIGTGLLIHEIKERKNKKSTVA